MNALITCISSKFHDVSAAQWIATIEPLESRALLSTYVVAPVGSGVADGTLQHPFRTIQHAADLAQPGDTVLVRGGTYRETIDPPRSGTADSPITFKPYNGETVTVSGADLVGKWTTQSASIFRAEQPWNLGLGRNQVFVDGRMMVEARWPNTTFNVSSPKKATADTIRPNVDGVNSTAELMDADLTQPAGYWIGATIHIMPGNGWVGQTGTVTESSPGRLVYRYEQMSSYEVPEKGDRYYLFGKFNALDSAGEWYRDNSGQLFLRTPWNDNPSPHVVEVKRRDHAFDLSGRSNITIDGFRIFSANIITDGASENVKLQNLDVRYAAHYTVMPAGWRRPTDMGAVVLKGTACVLENSTIVNSAGDGVYLAGKDNIVQRNVIRDVAYAAGDEAGIAARRPAGATSTRYSSGHVISYNTVYNTGRSGILTSYSTQVHVLHNIVHHVGLQTTDLGAIYTYGTDGTGSEIAYNVCYDSKGGGFGTAGIYLDNGSHHFLVHHNVAVYQGLLTKVIDEASPLTDRDAHLWLGRQAAGGAERHSKPRR